MKRIIAVWLVIIMLMGGMIGVVSAGTNTTNTSKAKDTGLVAQWHFNENTGTTASDSSGNGNDGTIHNAMWTSGVSGSALSFDGVDDFFEVSNNLNFGRNDFTVYLWVKYNNLNGEQVIIENYIETENINTRQGWTLTKRSDNVIRFGGAGSPSPDAMIIDTNPSITTNTWIFIALTRQSNTYTIYWNSQSIATTTTAGTYDFNSTASLKIGHRGNPEDTPGSVDTRNFYLNGIIDEVRIYNRALSASEIQAHYEEFALVQPPTTSVNTISPYWQTTTPLTIAGTASADTNAVQLWYKYSINNATWGSGTLFQNDTTAPWAWLFNFPNGSGHYQFYSKGYNLTAGWESSPITADAVCGFDNITPAITITGVLDSAYYKVNVTPVITITDQYLSTQIISLNDSSFTSGTVVSAEGKYYLNASASDLAGNIDSENIIFTIDKTAPVITITGVADGEKYESATPAITVTDYENSTILLNGAPFVSGTTISVENTYMLVVLATDKAGNNATKTITFTIDKTPPTISNLIPATGTKTTDGSIVFSGKTEPDADVKINGIDVSVSSDGSFSKEVTLVKGENTITITSTDLAGNTKTETITVTKTEKKEEGGKGFIPGFDVATLLVAMIGVSVILLRRRKDL